MIGISVVARCTQRNTPISPIKGIVGGVSRERALQAIRNDLVGILFNMLFNKGFKKASACRGPGACPCVCRRLQLACGKIGYGVGMNLAFTSAKFVQRAWGSFWRLISVRSIKKSPGHLSAFFLISALTHHFKKVMKLLS